MASLYRNIGLSVHHRLWQILLQNKFYTVYTTETLAKITVDLDKHGHASTYTYATDQALHGWVAIDADGDVDDSLVTVYVNGVLKASNTYKVDYVNGWVIFPSAPGGTVTASFTAWDVRVKRGFPDKKNKELLATIDLPVLSYSIPGETGTPWGVGSAAEFLTYDLTMDILATNGGMRDDIAGILRRTIIKLPVYDFEAAQPLGFGNALNPVFDTADQFIHDASFLRRPSSTTIEPKDGEDPKLQFHAVVHGEIYFVG